MAKPKGEMNREKVTVPVLEPIVQAKEEVIHATIVGLPPGLLMNSPQSLMDAKHGEPKKRGEIIDAKKDAERAAYRTTSGELYVPDRAIYGCLLNAASVYKIGRMGASGLLAGTMRIEPFEIGLGTSSYVINAMPAVIQGRGRVIRHRPWLKKWKASFRIIYDPTYGVTVDLLRRLLIEGGARIGILDFRPQHRGPFGRFKVEAFR